MIKLTYGDNKMNSQIVDAKKLYDSAYNLYDIGINKYLDSFLNVDMEIAHIIADNWLGKVGADQFKNMTFIYNKIKNLRNNLCAFSILSMMLAQKEDKNNNYFIPKYNETEMIVVLSKTSDEVVVNNDLKVGEEKLNSLLKLYDKFMNECKKYYDEILDNWKNDKKRDELEKKINRYFSDAKTYKEIIKSVLEITQKYVTKYL